MEVASEAVAGGYDESEGRRSGGDYCEGVGFEGADVGKVEENVCSWFLVQRINWLLLYRMGDFEV